MKIANFSKKWDADRAELNREISHLNHLEMDAVAKDRSDRNRREGSGNRDTILSGSRRSDSSSNGTRSRDVDGEYSKWRDS